MGYTIIKNGDTPNVQYNQYVCGSYADLSSIKNPVEGSIAYVPENGGVNEYIAIGGKWVNKVIILEEEPEDYVPVHPDWNENDSENPNFIHNRTHYKEETITTTSLTFDYDDDKNKWILRNESVFPLEQGINYSIGFNGITYNLTATVIEEFEGDNPGDNYILYGVGNLSFENDELYNDNECPFLLFYEIGQEISEDYELNRLIVTSEYEESEITLSIVNNSIVYYPLSENYLPNTVVRTDLLSQEGHSFDGELIANNFVRLDTPQIEGDTIAVTGFNNTAEYPCPEYMLEFTTGSTAPTLELPIEGVNWVEELTLEANKHYQISIMNGIALWCAVDVEVEEEEEGE